jgi:CheY-like chemotaxis protein
MTRKWSVWPRTMLGYRGYTVVEAVDGEEALQKFARHPAGLTLFCSI